MKFFAFGGIPPETLKATNDLLAQNPRYLQIGSQIEKILEECAPDPTRFAPEQPREWIVILALVTLFQSMEGYTDQQASEAVRARVDWKYALHLPLTHPGFEAARLCQFRAYVFRSMHGTAFIQTLAERLARIGVPVFDPDPGSNAVELLNSICKLNRMILITESLLSAAEALAAAHPVWPGPVGLAQLYESYSRILQAVHEVKNREGMDGLMRSIRVELISLLSTIAATGEDRLKALPEVRQLQMLWEKQSRQDTAGESLEQEVIWKSADCRYCEIAGETGF